MNAHWIEDIAGFLHDGDPSLGTWGQDIRQFLPVEWSKTQLITLLQSQTGQGALPATRIFQPRLQALCRSTDSAAAWLRAHQILDRLHGKGPLLLASRTFMQRCEAVGTPIALGPDPSGCYLVSVNFSLKIGTL